MTDEFDSYPDRLPHRTESVSVPGRGLGARINANLPAAPAVGTPGPLVQLAELGGVGGEVRRYNAFLARDVVGQLGAPTNPILAAVALIEWAVDGATFAAELDILNGSRFSVVANRLNIRAANEGTGNALLISGAIMPGGEAEPNEALRTRYIGNLLANSGNNRTILIPPFAKWWRIGYAPNNPGVATILDALVRDSAGNTLDNVRWNLAGLGQQPASVAFARIPLPCDAFDINVNASTVGAIDRARCIFGLAI